MDADEHDIVNYLRVWTGQYVSAREIARKAASKKRFQSEPDWAVPVLARLLEKRIVEADAAAHYRLLGDSKKEKRKRWISPAIQQILDKTGKDFTEGIEIDEPPAPAPADGEKKPGQKPGH